MAAIVIVGAQWGDEGKGKATDILGGKVDYVVKPNGGNNAGHTVVVGGDKYELKLLPAGILSENATPCLLYTSPSPRDATLSRMPSSA